MPNKQAIIENVEMYSADELIKFIKAGIVTFDELCNDTEGCFPASIRKEVAKKLDNSEEEDWEKAKGSHSVELLEQYLSTYITGIHRDEARNLIDFYSKLESTKELQSTWENIDKSNIDSLTEFCEKYPNDVHFKEAKKLINNLRIDKYIGVGVNSLVAKIKNIQTDRSVINADEEIFKTIVQYRENNKIQHSELLSMIKEDNNILRASIINMLLGNGYLDYEDFDTIGINPAFVTHLANGVQTQKFANPKKLDKINKLSTEVYFWGIPSSGKSCAIGAILSVAGNGRVAKSMKQDNDCQGYGYMTRLAQLFRNPSSVGTLPEGTSVYSTYEMGFDLEDENGATHPITCVDLAGELVRCMFKSDANEPMSEDEMESLDTLTRILIDNRSQNMKIHIFVLEYGADDRLYEGLSQQVYLEGALRYIERTGIFKKDTNAIYLMITKVDKLHAEKNQLPTKIKEYIMNSYGGFYNGLKKICRDCEINDGNVDILPFSLGKVCFQDYCLFDEKAATIVVRKILERSKGFKDGRSHRIMKIFKK